MVVSIENPLLKNAPLKEVVFELHWLLDFITEQNISNDEGFEEAVMNFTNTCNPNFSEFEILVPSMIPPAFFVNKVTHRFYKEKGKHPLYQMGPGVFTVNDNNKNYSWQEFKKLIFNGIECLKKSYKKELVLEKIELRYIDAVDANVFNDNDKMKFLRENLNVNVESYPFVNGQLIDVSYNKRFIINDTSYLNLLISTGIDKNTNSDIIIWHTFINNRQSISWNKLDAWLETAHDIASGTFKNMTSQKLYEYFS